MRRRLLRLTRMMATALTATALWGCADAQLPADGSGDGDATAVRFSPYMGRQAASRAESYYGRQGDMTEDALRETGFGVLAYYTDDQPYGDNAGPDKEPDFMYNQKVAWNGSGWEYWPTKYWPNERGLDDSDGRTDYVSFFAYAPYVPAFEGSKYDKGSGYGITEFKSNATTVSAMFLGYHMAFDNARDVDLLYATAIDQTKKDIGQTVDLNFRHALASIRLTVQGVFDETAPGSNDIDASQSRILIDRVQLKGRKVSNGEEKHLFPRTGNFYLSYNQPRWQQQGGHYYLDVESTIDSRLKDVNMSTDYGNSAEAFFADDGKVGVTSSPMALCTDNPRIIPFTLADDRELIIEVTYTVYTYDPQLVRNTPKHLSKVTNTISQVLGRNANGTAEGLTAFESNKAYTINMRLGMTTVKFDVHAVDDWGEGEQQQIYLPQNELKGGT